MPSVHDINTMMPDDALAAFEKCCGAWNWYHAMMQSRPFSSAEKIFEKSAAIFSGFSRQDWLEAFAHHPKIGDLDSLRTKFAGTGDWAGKEQSGIQRADFATLAQFAALNKEYEAKFGYIFIVCATGKTAHEMLQLLLNRLPNNPEKELRIAGGEQAKITDIRLGKLLVP
ncbi:2-oxo-4-hydroxy-4-carboxy-5-ureidoimidazoline decarboxylase [Candidatus Sumerlaeota bacterium]|nr:2-oxo-4-hydroxy-4-carboxy-5-ureidoimidazoline decarboxylase [Candidatus Sumerlaeota bacterium]